MVGGYVEVVAWTMCWAHGHNYIPKENNLDGGV